MPCGGCVAALRSSAARRGKRSQPVWTTLLGEIGSLDVTVSDSAGRQLSTADVATEQHAPLPSPPQDGPPSLAVEGTAASHRGRRRHWAAQRPSGGSPFSAAFAAEHAGLILAIVLGVLLPVVVAAATGNLSIPHNDAWSYSRIAQTFGRTGHIRLLDWNRSALVGQFVVLGPLASSIVVTAVETAHTISGSAMPEAYPAMAAAIHSRTVRAAEMLMNTSCSWRRRFSARVRRRFC